VGKLCEEITPHLGMWLKQQHMFFVATSPLAQGDLVNRSPKGMDCLRPRLNGSVRPQRIPSNLPRGVV